VPQESAQRTRGTGFRKAFPGEETPPEDFAPGQRRPNLIRVPSGMEEAPGPLEQTRLHRVAQKDPKAQQTAVGGCWSLPG